MVLTELAVGCVAACKRIKSIGADIGKVWQRLMAVHRRRRRGDHERYFGGSADRFELERRERAFTRWDSIEGSLLGR